MCLTRFFFVALILAALSVWGQVESLAAPLTNLNNKHNLSSSATHGGPQAQPPGAGGTDQICIFCHTPHSATPESTLWSRPDPNTAVFPLYGNPLVIKGDYSGAPANAQDHSQYKNDGSVTYPNGATRMCLSCHDGATAIGILNDGTSIAMLGGQNLVTGQAVIDLSTSHPVSFVYDNVVLGDINVTAKSGDYRLPPSGDGVDAPLDGKDRMQCTTCHDPHNDTNLDSLGLPFWRHTTLVDSGTYSNVYEELCGQCHIGTSTFGVPAGDHNPGPSI